MARDFRMLDELREKLGSAEPRMTVASKSEDLKNQRSPAERQHAKKVLHNLHLAAANMAQLDTKNTSGDFNRALTDADTAIAKLQAEIRVRDRVIEHYRDIDERVHGSDRRQQFRALMFRILNALGFATVFILTYASAGYFEIQLPMMRPF